MQPLLDFDGATYDRQKDGVRLGEQLGRVREFMLRVAPRWHTLAQLAAILGYPEASISARLRDLRKERFGGYTVERRRRTDGRGTWEYRIKR